MKHLFLFFSFVLIMTSCASVDSGNKGVEVSWGGSTNMDKVYPEGLNWGLHWLFDDMVEYDCKEKTEVETFEFNDINSMETRVEVSVDYQLDPGKVNLLHTKITDVDTKLKKTIKSAAKEVIPNYGAVDLNLTKRGDAEAKLAKILEKELPEFYLKFARVQITDVDLPKEIAEQAKKTATQIEKNKLASKLEEEQTNLAKAAVAKAKGEFEAAEYNSRSAELMSTPANLKLKDLDVQMKWAEKGVSPYGENNVFGSQPGLSWL
jgi:regulator of protease activity HflC (stomatin/prohibitin superfamily)